MGFLETGEKIREASGQKNGQILVQHMFQEQTTANLRFLHTLQETKKNMKKLRTKIAKPINTTTQLQYAP